MTLPIFLQKQLGNKGAKSFLALCLLVFFGFFLGVNADKISNFALSNSYIVSGAEIISPQKLNQALTNKDFTLINVHTPYEGEIKNTDLFIGYDEFIASRDKLPKDKNASIVLYCKTGKMSSEALKTLKSLGYINVRRLAGGMEAYRGAGYEIFDLSRLGSAVLPQEGLSLPVGLGNLGPELVSLGVIDLAKFEKATQLGDGERKILTQGGAEQLKITAQNSQFIVNMLWALGLAQKSFVYSEGPMGEEYKDKVGSFASTGGWTLARGNAVDHLNRHELIPLSVEQQGRVIELAKNIYRPCCGNSTWFPDCNHGMAALGAIELMVANNVPDGEIYKNILALNSYWFPSDYITIATHFARQGVSWDKVDAKLILGQEFSSGQGAAEIREKVGLLPYEKQKGGSCGV